MKVDEIPLLETEAARKIMEEVIDSDEKKSDSFDKEISEQVMLGCSIEILLYVQPFYFP